jgi:hypothetical protein
VDVVAVVVPSGSVVDVLLTKPGSMANAVHCLFLLFILGYWHGSSSSSFRLSFAAGGYSSADVTTGSLVFPFLRFLIFHINLLEKKEFL